MFRLTDAQINAVVPDMQRKFDKRMLATLLAKYEDVAQIREDGLLDYIATTRTRAQSLGFRTEQHILDVVEACTLNGDKLWSNPTFDRIIAAKLMTQEEKSASIRKHFISEIDPKLLEQTDHE